MKDKQKVEPDQTTAMSGHVPSKMFATDGNDRDRVAVYNFFCN